MSAIAPDLLRPVRLPTVSEQLAVLLDAGLAERAGVSREELRTWVSPLRADATAVLVVHPCLVAPSRLVTLLRRGRRSGITAADVSDFDALEPIDGIELPAHPLYLVHAVEGGGDLAGTGAGAAGAAGALTEIGARGRRPLTASETLSWLLQQPEHLRPGRALAALGSRPRPGDALDRHPAVAVSPGTGPLRLTHRGAPTLAWSASADRRAALAYPSAAVR